MSILVPIESAGDREQYGGKSANLALLKRLDLVIPDGRVVPAAEFTRQVASCDAANIATDIASRALRSELADALRDAVTALGGRVSVRSSATLEDARTHSFAGQFQTVLNVGPDGVEAAVREVWASAFSDHVSAYLRRADLDPAKLAMAVVIQRQIDSDASGVAMGASNGTIVEAVFGQGEGIVSGAITADHWEVRGKAITTARIAEKASRIGIPNGAPTGAVIRTALAGAERNHPSLSDAQVLEVVAACDRIAAACDGRRQDCEFAFAGGTLYLLQTRDVTASLPMTPPPLATFAPPGKGAWEIDTSHFRRPCTALFQSVFPAAMRTGFAEATERYGALLSHIDTDFVNGFAYMRLRPVGAPADATAKPPPPMWLLRLLLKVVPSLRRRVKAADRLWLQREWRVQFDAWNTTVKPRAIADHRHLQSVDLATLDDAALGAHFRATCEHAARMVEQHHAHTLATLIPLGDLLAHVALWSNNTVAESDVFALLTGASPITADLSCPEARSLGAALAANAAAVPLLRLDTQDATISDHDAAAALATLRALPGDTGERVREFLAMREFRLVEGLDPGAPCLSECPALLWQAVRSTALATRAAADHDVEAPNLGHIRAAVPADKHAELDALIAEARTVAPLRDERALFSDVWAWGIVRTTVLEIGRRLKRRSSSLLVDPADLVCASPDEITSLLLHSKGPSAEELETRAAHRRSYTTNDAPATLGPKALPPPSPDKLPVGVRRLSNAIANVIGHVLAPRAERSANGMHGNPASSGVWEGPVHVVNSHDDARDIPAGAVLVVSSGSSSFTMLAPLASAVVAEGGGLLSHVAIVCREYRIPCVCGVAGVLDTLQSGQRVRVDGTRGVVEVLR